MMERLHAAKHSAASNGKMFLFFSLLIALKEKLTFETYLFKSRPSKMYILVHSS